MKSFLKAAVLVLFIGTVFSCSQEEKKQQEPVAPAPVVEKKITDSTVFKNDLYNFDPASGPIGVYDMPEMLVLSMIDSARQKDVSAALVKDYAILEEEMNAIGAEMNGPVGMISYSNDLKNFIFEPVICIKKIPAKQPTRCKIVVLEASKVLVYNFYGPYQSLFSAYDKIKRYCEKNDLLQSGPIREFYITDPDKEPDQKKWLTRIVLPIVSMRSK